MKTKSVRANFIFLSQIINLPVIDTAGRKVGILDDIIADVQGLYPRINGLIIRRGVSRQRGYLPWKCVQDIKEDRSLAIECSESLIEPVKLSQNEIKLRETFWDKQIVDISGSKVVRVNDLHILKDGIKLWLVHMDVGFKGFLRRLGWLKAFGEIVKWLFSYELRDKFISWKYVQPITTAGDLKSLSLKIPHSKLS